MRVLFYRAGEWLNSGLEDVGHWAIQRSYRPWLILLLTSFIFMCALLGIVTFVDRVAHLS